VERFNGRIQREVLGITVASPYHGSVWGMSHSAQRGGMAIRR
jgi:hypothetical protein